MICVDEEWLEEWFPLGDGVADVGAWVTCPCCGAELELVLDPGGGPAQEYVEDCETCCRPLRLTVRWDRHGTAHVEARPEDD